MQKNRVWISMKNVPFISAESYFQIWVPGKDIHMISLLWCISHCPLVTLGNLKN